jgi:hypothetical protein
MKYVYCAFKDTKQTRICEDHEKDKILAFAEREGMEVYRLPEETYNDPSGARYGWDGPTFRITAEKIYPPETEDEDTDCDGSCRRK